MCAKTHAIGRSVCRPGSATLILGVMYTGGRGGGGWVVTDEDAMVGCVSEPTAVVTVCQYASGGMDELPKDVRLAPAEL